MNDVDPFIFRFIFEYAARESKFLKLGKSLIYFFEKAKIPVKICNNNVYIHLSILSPNVKNGFISHMELTYLMYLYTDLNLLNNHGFITPDSLMIKAFGSDICRVFLSDRK